MSAYSVFNPGCENITGTFSGDDIDKQYRHGTLLRGMRGGGR
jgi:hypothetical protein